MTETSSLEYLDNAIEIVEVAKVFDDPELENILNDALKLLIKPNLKNTTAANLMVQFEAASLKYHLIAKKYQALTPGKAGSEEAKKKQLAYSLHESLHELAQVMKLIYRGPGY